MCCSSSGPWSPGRPGFYPSPAFNCFKGWMFFNLVRPRGNGLRSAKLLKQFDFGTAD